MAMLEAVLGALSPPLTLFAGERPVRGVWYDSGGNSGDAGRSRLWTGGARPERGSLRDGVGGGGIRSASVKATGEGPPAALFWWACRRRGGIGVLSGAVSGAMHSPTTSASVPSAVLGTPGEAGERCGRRLDSSCSTDDAAEATLARGPLDRVAGSASVVAMAAARCAGPGWAVAAFP